MTLQFFLIHVFLTDKSSVDKTFCFRANKLLQLEQKESIGYFFHFTHLFSLSLRPVYCELSSTTDFCMYSMMELLLQFVHQTRKKELLFSQLVGTGMCWQCYWQGSHQPR